MGIVYELPQRVRVLFLSESDDFSLLLKEVRRAERMAEEWAEQPRVRRDDHRFFKVKYELLHRAAMIEYFFTDIEDPVADVIKYLPDKRKWPGLEILRARVYVSVNGYPDITDDSAVCLGDWCTDIKHEWF